MIRQTFRVSRLPLRRGPPPSRPPRGRRLKRHFHRSPEWTCEEIEGLEGLFGTAAGPTMDPCASGTFNPAQLLVGWCEFDSLLLSRMKSSVTPGGCATPGGAWRAAAPLGRGPWCLQGWFPLLSEACWDVCVSSPTWECHFLLFSASRLGLPRRARPCDTAARDAAGVRRVLRL